MASSTDVRTWAADNGYDVAGSGRLPKNVIADYEAAHGGDPGVSDDDFPPAPAAQAPPRQPSRGGGRGRAKAPGKRRARRGWRESLRSWGSARGPRSPLSDFAEETWSDLAWLAQPLPPLSRMLQAQAPYAGVVFDESVAGTPVDVLLQPIARYSGSLRALNGLIGPPVIVAAICAQGNFLVRDDKSDYVRDAAGRPVPDGRTAMLLQTLRYTLLQMAKVADLKEEEIRERAGDMQARMKAVDAMVDSIFDWGPRQAAPGAPPGAPPPGDPAHPGPPGGGRLPVPAQVYVYPPGSATQMDTTGADPRRYDAGAPVAPPP